MIDLELTTGLVGLAAAVLSFGVVTIPLIKKNAKLGNILSSFLKGGGSAFFKKCNLGQRTLTALSYPELTLAGAANG